HDAPHGDWVIARITRHAGSTTPAQAVIGKRLDPDRPVELATESAIARCDLPHEFPAAALREAQAYGEQVDSREASARADLRELPLVTIDGEDARDFDDAVYTERCPGGFRLIVAIADVSHYVRPGTALDTEAQTRGTSVYFPTRVLPMLPTALSDHLCSLAPRVDRLCFAADMVVSSAGALKSARFYAAVMRSAARLTYTLANDALFAGRPAARTQLGPLLEPLMVLVDVYRALYQARNRRGALDIDARIPKTVSTRDLQAIARRVGNAPERAFVESLVVRAMPQAIYQPTNIGHFGLALAHYVHFTSPIRRYPDLVVHRTLKAMIGAPGGSGRRYETSELGRLGESTSRLEKRADEADRYVSGFLKCTYLKERVGQTFQGLITTVVVFGCFVQILD